MISKKEFKIGEVFQFGLKKLKVVETTSWSCKDCYFGFLCQNEYHGILEEEIGYCGSCDRSDRKEVYFVEVKEEE